MRVVTGILGLLAVSLLVSAIFGGGARVLDYLPHTDWLLLGIGILFIIGAGIFLASDWKRSWKQGLVATVVIAAIILLVISSSFQGSSSRSVPQTPSAQPRR